MRAVDVFTPNRLPTITFIHDHLRDKEALLRDSLEKGGALISISGPSKSGKTVFVDTVLGQDNVVKITGAGVKNVDDLWIQVFHQIGTPVEQIEAVTEASHRTVAGQGEVEGNAIFAKAKASTSISKTTDKGSTVTQKKATTYLQLLIAELAGTGTAVFIDDFHYMDAGVQAEVAKQIKDAISKEVLIICASVPYRSEDVLRANNELQGRIISIDFDYWNPEVLLRIADAGFAALNIDAANDLKRFFAEESAGSPQLMQSLCLDACFATGFKERGQTVSIEDGHEIRTLVCSRSAASVDYSTTLERMKLGPRVRGTPRAGYLLTDQSVQDVYVTLIRALALAPPILHFQYPELVKRINGLCSQASPPGSSITTACEQLALIANAGQERNLIDWDVADDVMDLREPLLLFFLRWSGAV